ncbi:MAG TPA: ester cyclase [Bryobacteraceae bacterium]|nr:ester cyclase [Bryobacteraceae bacterium]
MSEQENIERVRQGVALLNAHDFATYVQRIDESYIAESETVPGGVHGPAGVRQQLDLLLGAFPDLRVELEQVLASGDHVVTRIRLSGTHKGTFAGIAPTNKIVSWGVCGVSEIRNGKAIRGRLYGDNASLLQQIGALSMPKATSAG